MSYFEYRPDKDYTEFEKMSFSSVEEDMAENQRIEGLAETSFFEHSAIALKETAVRNSAPFSFFHKKLFESAYLGENPEAENKLIQPEELKTLYGITSEEPMTEVNAAYQQAKNNEISEYETFFKYSTLNTAERVGAFVPSLLLSALPEVALGAVLTATGAGALIGMPLMLNRVRQLYNTARLSKPVLSRVEKFGRIVQSYAKANPIKTGILNTTPYSVAEEIALHKLHKDTNTDYSVLESVFAIGGAGLIGGLLGRSITKRLYKEIGEEIAEKAEKTVAKEATEVTAKETVEKAADDVELLDGPLPTKETDDIEIIGADGKTIDTKNTKSGEGEIIDADGNRIKTVIDEKDGPRALLDSDIKVIDSQGREIPRPANDKNLEIVGLEVKPDGKTRIEVIGLDEVQQAKGRNPLVDELIDPKTPGREPAFTADEIKHINGLGVDIYELVGKAIDGAENIPLVIKQIKEAFFKRGIPKPLTREEKIAEFSEKKTVIGFVKETKRVAELLRENLKIQAQSGFHGLPFKQMSKEGLSKLRDTMLKMVDELPVIHKDIHLKRALKALLKDTNNPNLIEKALVLFERKLTYLETVELLKRSELVDEKSLTKEFDMEIEKLIKGEFRLGGGRKSELKKLEQLALSQQFLKQGSELQKIISKVLNSMGKLLKGHDADFVKQFGKNTGRSKSKIIRTKDRGQSGIALGQIPKSKKIIIGDVELNNSKKASNFDINSIFHEFIHLIGALNNPIFRNVNRLAAPELPGLKKILTANQLKALTEKGNNTPVIRALEEVITIIATNKLIRQLVGITDDLKNQLDVLGPAEAKALIGKQTYYTSHSNILKRFTDDLKPKQRKELHALIEEEANKRVNSFFKHTELARTEQLNSFKYYDDIKELIKDKDVAEDFDKVADYWKDTDGESYVSFLRVSSYLLTYKPKGYKKYILDVIEEQRVQAFADFVLCKKGKK